MAASDKFMFVPGQNNTRIKIKLVDNGDDTYSPAFDTTPVDKTILSGTDGAGALFTSADQHSAAASVTGAAGAGEHLHIVDIAISSDTAMNLIFKEETSGTVIWKTFIPANGFVHYAPATPIRLPTAVKKLQVLASVAGNISVLVQYYTE